MIRYILRGLAPAALLACASAAEAQEAPARWHVDGSTDRCVLQRRLQGTPVPATFILRTVPASGRYDVILAAPDLPGDLRRIGRSVILSLPPGRGAARVAGRTVDLPDSLGEGIVFGPLPAEFAAAFAAAARLELADTDGRALGAWTLPVAARAAEAMAYCEAEKQVEWGADPAAFEPGAVPPRPVGNSAEWLRPQDFGATPNSLVPASYTAVFRLLIDEQGRAAGCTLIESAGNVEFDRACRTLSSRARYEPARDASGDPVKSVAVHVSSVETRIEFHIY